MVKSLRDGQKIVFAGQKVLVPALMAAAAILPAACVGIKYVDRVITVFLLPAPVTPRAPPPTAKPKTPKRASVEHLIAEPTNFVKVLTICVM